MTQMRRPSLFVPGKSLASHHSDLTVYEGVQQLEAGLRANRVAAERHLGRLVPGLSRDITRAIDQLNGDVTSALGSGFDQVTAGLAEAADDVVFAIDRLQAALGEQLSGIRWELAVGNQLLRELLHVHLESLNNESRQRYEQAIKCYRVGELDMALEQLSQALERDTTNYFAWQYLGLAQADRDQYEGATRSFDLAQKFAPTNIERARSLQHLSTCLTIRGDADGAVEAARNAVTNDPEAPANLVASARTLARFSAEGWTDMVERSIVRQPYLFGIVPLHEEFAGVADVLGQLLSRLKQERHAHVKALTREVRASWKSAERILTEPAAVRELKAAVDAGQAVTEETPYAEVAGLIDQLEALGRSIIALKMADHVQAIAKTQDEIAVVSGARDRPDRPEWETIVKARTKVIAGAGGVLFSAITGAIDGWGPVSHIFNGAIWGAIFFGLGALVGGVLGKRYHRKRCAENKRANLARRKSNEIKVGKLEDSIDALSSDLRAESSLLTDKPLLATSDDDEATHDLVWSGSGSRHGEAAVRALVAQAVMADLAPDEFSAECVTLCDARDWAVRNLVSSLGRGQLNVRARDDSAES